MPWDKFFRAQTIIVRIEPLPSEAKFRATANVEPDRGFIGLQMAVDEGVKHAGRTTDFIEVSGERAVGITDLLWDWKYR